MIAPDTLSIHGAALSRRSFLKTGGAMIVALGIKPNVGSASAGTNSLDATRPSSWIEINADNTLLIRTGKCDFGQSSIYTAYRQIVAEELDVPVDAITSVVSGDTDRTPDGGGTFGLLRTNVLNLRKAAAYTREAALELAARELAVPRADLSVSEGVISGGGKSITYGALVTGKIFELTIPVSGGVTDFGGLRVTGDPPLKAPAKYKVIGQPIKNPSLRPKMSGEMTWVNDVKLPGMLHARVVHPATLGSKLISAGTIDKEQFPTSRVVVIGNLVAVVSEKEWEAVLTAQALAGTTTWSEWQGLPGHEKLLEHLQNSVDWSEIQAADGAKKGSATDTAASAARTHSATYFMPYHKHAPICPTVSVGDVKADGSVTVHTHSQNPQFLRQAIARMLGRPEGDVVVRTYPGAGHYGRSNGGNAGSEDEAVLLSRAVGKPVRVQWMRPDDMLWSTQSPASMASIRISLDEGGKIQAYQAEHRGPPMQDDRPIGAVLAGLPTMEAPSPTHPSPLHGTTLRIADRWVYGAIPNVAEVGRGTYQIGQRESPIAVGLRDHSMRTPIQFQQNFPREVAFSEAAALAGIDPIQFRIDHTDDERFKTILARLREESGWEKRPSPSPQARSKGNRAVHGQGVGIMWRDNGYWACACHIAVTPDTGVVKVERLTIVLDLGVVVNPLQLKRQVQAGSLMGVSQALHEEVTFDEGAITSNNWAAYPILTMAEMPEVKVVIAARPEFGVYGQGSEGANACAASAIAAAFLDATGKPVRRIPLKPDYVKTLLAS